MKEKKSSQTQTGVDVRLSYDASEYNRVERALQPFWRHEYCKLVARALMSSPSASLLTLGTVSGGIPLFIACLKARHFPSLQLSEVSVLLPLIGCFAAVLVAAIGCLLITQTLLASVFNGQEIERDPKRRQMQLEFAFAACLTVAMCFKFALAGAPSISEAMGPFWCCLLWALVRLRCWKWPALSTLMRVRAGESLIPDAKLLGKLLLFLVAAPLISMIFNEASRIEGDEILLTHFGICVYGANALLTFPDLGHRWRTRALFAALLAFCSIAVGLFDISRAVSRNFGIAADSVDLVLYSDGCKTLQLAGLLPSEESFADGCRVPDVSIKMHVGSDRYVLGFKNGSVVKLRDKDVRSEVYVSRDVGTIRKTIQYHAVQSPR